MLDRSKIKALPSHKEILSKGYKDVSGSIQEKKGAFKFDPVDPYSSLREYRVASNGTVSWFKEGFGKPIDHINLNNFSEYDKAFKSILGDIEKFSAKMSRKSDLLDERVAYREYIIKKPLEVKRRILRAFLIIALFEEKYADPPLTASGILNTMEREGDVDILLRSRLHPNDASSFKKSKKTIEKLI